LTVWFTADLHLGHRLIAQTRGFGEDVVAHDKAVISSLKERISKRDKTFILGDVAFNRTALRRIDEISGIKVLILGNHDKNKAHAYLEHFDDLHGALRYKDFIVTHIPIHPNEMGRFKGNIHGHVHTFSNTPPIEDKRYFNVGVEFHQFLPVSFERDIRGT